MAGQREERLVRVAVAHDEVEASVWRDALEQEGIVVFIKNADPLGSFGIAPSLPFSLELLVPATDQRRARWLLGQLEPEGR